MTSRQVPIQWTNEVRQVDSPVRTRFLESHVGLVKYEALRIAQRLPSSVEIDDLVHDGIVGLIDAAGKFDPSRGVTFRTYAMTRVRGEILDALRRRDWRSRGSRESHRQLEDTIRRLASVSGRAPTEEEIAAGMGLDAGSYHELLREASLSPLVSLQEIPPENEPIETREAGRPAQAAERRELLEVLATELAALPERDRRLLNMYYMDELNMKEIGLVLGVTESRVCQMHAQAAARLRAALRSKLTRPGQAAARAAMAARGKERI